MGRKVLNGFISCFLPLALTSAVFGFLFHFQNDSPFVESVFLRAWYIQGLNTWLFLIALIQWWRRNHMITTEQRYLRNVEFPLDLRRRAVELARSVPQPLQDSLAVRRLRDILNAVRYREDSLRLASELSARDSDRLERANLVLNSLRSVIPVIGFLGTVFGLSLGLLQFPDVSDVDSLRNALKEFASNLSIAFTTTLLALAYTIILILITAMLRQREQELLDGLDDTVMELIERVQEQAVR